MQSEKRIQTPSAKLPKPRPSVDEIVAGIFKISKDDVKRIVGKRPGKKRKK